MIYKNFDEYMQFMHQEANPTILDDDLPDHFQDWICLDWDDMKKYADKYASIKSEEAVEYTLNNLPEPDYEPADFSGACGTNDR